MVDFLECGRPGRAALVAVGAVWAAAAVGCGAPDTRDLCPDGQCHGEGGAGSFDGGGSTTGTASGGGTTGATGTSGTTGVDAGTSGSARQLPCDVQEIVDEHCVSCHSDPPMGTYMPLSTHAHFHAPSTTEPSRMYYELAQERIHATEDPMPPPGSSTLSDAERATLNAWLEAGAPASEEVCAVPPPVDAGVDADTWEPIDPSELECHRFLAHAPGDKDTKFDVGVVQDAYFNMVFQAPWEETVYAVIIRPIIDNAPVLHHWLLYREPLAGLDGDVWASGGQHTVGELVHGWAPGGSALDFSDRGDVAFEMPSSTYVMEFHYNSADPNAKDASGAEVCFRRDPPKHVAGLSWLGSDHGFESYIAGAIGGGWASGNCLFPAAEWTGTCDPPGTEPIHLMVVWPHMHERGVRMKAVINGPNGSRVLHDETFDFDYQKAYEVDEVLMPGETITTTCEFTEPACAGQATSAEMCYLYTYAWPKGSLYDFGVWGRTAHGDNVCLGQ